jgi:copper homeostasis protein
VRTQNLKNPENPENPKNPENRSILKSPVLLEVIVQSVADARAAEMGGADRLEVVRDITRDGLTPSVDVVRAIQSETRLPLRVMVRDSDSFTTTGADEILSLQRAFAAFAELGVDGAVTGFARSGQLDLETTLAVLSAAPPLRVTFHRAFDSLIDPDRTIDILKTVPQVDRILTSGGTGDWNARCARLAAFAARAGSKLTILPGGGVDEGGLRALAATPSIREAHVGRAACEPPIPGAPVSADRVRRLKRLL